ncbi:carboxylesterase family protein [Corynebacterium variabile]|uniref:carboxylesterase family protein n=1 Tax=Corynebacterium variabile TaxID=1727 RepID=UPI003FD3A3E1
MSSTAQPEKLTVQTTEGPVTGVSQGATTAWNGVPYATPPVGELRFRRPQPTAHRDEPLETTTWGPSPMQPPAPETMGGVGDHGVTDEDCLTLNIVRPAGDATDLPVMVWIYGGAFTVGASRNYDGRHLAARGDVVVVTVNYRVGPWGFLDLSSLSTPEHTFESNTGLHDQIAALRWVRDNISAFGGDPTNITLFGESAGGSSVLSLMCMPEADGLFHRVIAQSPAVAGTPASVHAKDAAHLAQIVTGGTGGTGDAGSSDPAAAAAALHDMLAEVLLAASLRSAAETGATDPGRLIYGPTVDGESLPAALLAAFATGRQAQVPLVIGTNASEGLSFLLSAQATGSEILPVLPDTMRATLGESAAADAVFAAYPGFPEPEASAQAGGDMVFWYPATVVGDAHATVASTTCPRIRGSVRSVRPTVPRYLSSSVGWVRCCRARVRLRMTRMWSSPGRSWTAGWHSPGPVSRGRGGPGTRRTSAASSCSTGPLTAAVPRRLTRRPGDGRRGPRCTTECRCPA